MTSTEYQEKREAYLRGKMSHEDFYLWVAGVIGWEWKTASMGKSVEWWAEKYRLDKHLNNVPLRRFDQLYPMFRRAAEGKGVWIAQADNVCVLKAIICRKVKDSLEEP